MSVGKHLGRYELLEQLGEGGMGTVWLARLSGAAGFEKLCIVKTVLPSIAKDADFVSRFLHEGRVLTQLSHGNIAQVLDMNEADGQLFLALEYVAGVDLARLHEQVRAAQEFMPLPLVAALITQAAEGLGAAHRKAALDGSPLNVVHRDVSPHNIMVSYEGEVKVIDFGIAKSEARSRHTAQASVMGKLGYMAPEQARGEAVDHRADQFALAIVAWELLSNQSWVRRGTLTEMVVAMANPTIRLLAPTRPDVPPSLEAVVLKALSPNPDARFGSTDEFAQALMGELLKLGPPPTKPQLGQYVRSRCSDDFATQRALLTRVSTQRSPPPPADRPKSDMFAETAVRPAPPVPTQQQEIQAPTMELRPASAVTAVEPPGVATPSNGRETSPSRPAVLQTPAASSPGAPAEVRPEVRVDLPAVTPRGDAPLTTGELRATSQKRSPLLLVGGLVASLALLAVVGYALRPQPQPQAQPQPELVAAIDAGAQEVVVIDAGAPLVVIAPPPVDAGVEEAPIVDAGPPEPEPVDLGNLRVTGRLGRSSWSLSNRGSRNWTRCRMTLPLQRVMDIGTMAKGRSVELPLNRFRFNASAPRVWAQGRIDCDQGYGLIP